MFEFVRQKGTYGWWDQKQCSPPQKGCKRNGRMDECMDGWVN